MLKVDNKKAISDIAKTTYRANKKRNILTITAIFLTAFLIYTVISIGLSYWNTVSLRQQRMNGIDYDIELSEPREKQVSIIRDMEKVKCFKEFYRGRQWNYGEVSSFFNPFIYTAKKNALKLEKF